MSAYLNILGAAVKLTYEGGPSNITRDRVAESAGVAPSLLYHYFPSVEFLRDCVMEIAVDTNDARLLMHGIRTMHPLALKAPVKLREEAVALLSTELMGE